MAVSELAPSCDYRALAQGTWHIAMSTLPMWRKRAGAVTYCNLPGGRVSDVVSWQQGRRHGTIAGIDQAIDEDGWQWEWRGVEPLTFFVRSRWKFIAGDGRLGWAVTEFEKTLFTPAGIDIYCRVPHAKHAQLREALGVLSDEQARQLQTLPAWDEAVLVSS